MYEAEPSKKRIKLSQEYEVPPAREDSYPGSPINLSYSTLSPKNDGSTFHDSPQPQAKIQPEPQIEQPQPTPARIISSAKPNYTYTDLITLALKDKTSLTVSGIYQWIT